MVNIDIQEEGMMAEEPGKAEYKHVLVYNKPSHSTFVLDTRNIVIGLLNFIKGRRQRQYLALTIIQEPVISWSEEQQTTTITFSTQEQLFLYERQYISLYALAEKEHYNINLAEVKAE